MLEPRLPMLPRGAPSLGRLLLRGGERQAVQQAAQVADDGAKVVATVKVNPRAAPTPGSDFAFGARLEWV
eukprot:4755070-Pleurochrysis_carterae.AAC.1